MTKNDLFPLPEYETCAEDVSLPKKVHERPKSSRGWNPEPLKP